MSLPFDGSLKRTINEIKSAKVKAKPAIIVAGPAGAPDALHASTPGLAEANERACAPRALTHNREHDDPYVVKRQSPEMCPCD